MVLHTFLALLTNLQATIRKVYHLSEPIRVVNYDAQIDEFSTRESPGLETFNLKATLSQMNDHNSMCPNLSIVLN